jgi:hypothetical protein
MPLREVLGNYNLSKAGWMLGLGFIGFIASLKRSEETTVPS